MFGKKFPSEKYTQNKMIMEFYHNFEDENFFYSDLCKGCGMCCKKSGCSYFVEDFDVLNKSTLLELLKKGNTSIISTMRIDYINKRIQAVPILSLRVRGENREIVDLYSLQTKCSMLSENGCLYEKNERPLGSKLLIPIKVNGTLDCKTCADVLDNSLDSWMEYQKLLEKMVKYFSGNTVKQQLAKDIERVVLNIGRKILEARKVTEQEIELLQPLSYLDSEYFGNYENYKRELVACLALVREFKVQSC